MSSVQEPGFLLSGRSRRRAVPQTLATPSQAARWEPSITLAVALLAVAVRLFFWYYTRRTWEDGLITLQHAENAARGFGLTHVPGGPRVHGFTSPISVLIPLLGELLHTGFGLPLLKLISALSAGFTVWLAMRIARRLGLAFPIALLIGGYLALEHQQILFGMAGMESQLAAMLLLFSIYSLFELRPLWVGIGLGLCMLVRPDFVLWVPVALVLMLWHCWSRRNYAPLETVGLALLLTYGPWLAFTTWYYGGPLPNTILAKFWAYSQAWYRGLPPAQIALGAAVRARSLFLPLGPCYGGNGGPALPVAFDPHGVISGAVALLAVIGLVVALTKKQLAATAIAGFLAVYSLYFVIAVGAVFPWYVVPLNAVAILAAGLGLDWLVKSAFRGRWRSLVGYSLATAYLAVFVAIIPATFRGERNLQRFVEDGGRKRVGLYLASIVQPGQTIGCEALGYFGYYSRRLIFDYPGLANPQVVRFLRDHPAERNLDSMLGYFHPDYIVLRPQEYNGGLTAGDSWLLTDYQLIAKFQVPEEEQRTLLMPEYNIDLTFYILRLKSVAGNAPAMSRTDPLATSRPD